MCNRAVGYNQTPVIWQLKHPIILSPLSWIHQSQNIAATITLKNLGILKMEEIFTLNNVSTSKIGMIMITW